MARHLIVMLALILLVATESANATLESFDFTDSVSEQRFRGLIEELRCLVCQNESLLASQADLARDLREEVYTMMAEGKTDAEVITFLVDRYGNFVLYKPPLNPSTFILWFGPFALLLLSAAVLCRNIYRRSRTVDTPLSDKDRKRVSQLLGDVAERDEAV